MKNKYLIFFLIITIPGLLIFGVDLYNKNLDKKFELENKDIVFPIILSITGEKLNEYEKILIEKINPYGIILLTYNIKSVEQVKNLRNEIESILDRKIVLFVDQEGGLVNRLKNAYPKNKYPAPDYYRNIAAKNLEKSKKLMYDNSIMTAKNLKELGIDVNLGLMLDVPDKKVINGETKSDIGRRSYSGDPNTVKILSGEAIDAYGKIGVDLCAKHFLGLGSSNVDTHDEMAAIDKTIGELWETDFVPLKNLKGVKYGMVGHAIYKSIDPDNPATFSKKAVNFIRNELNFSGILISDALHMEALNGYKIGERIEKTLESGIDLALIMFDVRNEKNLEIVLSYVMPVKEKLYRNNRFVKTVR